MALLVTLDTMALHTAVLLRLQVAARGLDVDFVNVSVSDRELDGARTRPLPNSIPEGAILGESRFGAMVLWGTEMLNLFECALSLMSGGGFPKPSCRGNLTCGQQHLMRDALILEAHVRSKRDILVSNDTRAFGKPNTPLRRQLEVLCSTRIMTVDEFCDPCANLATATEE